jgi:hypothetical protein
MTWKRTKKQAKEIKDAISIWRDHGKTLDFESLDLKPSQCEALLKLENIMHEWRRMNVSNISEESAEHTVKEMISAMNWWKKKGKDYDAIESSLNTVPAMRRHKMVTDTLSDWNCDLGASKKEFKHLSPKEAAKSCKDLDESLRWWDREGKNLNVDQDLEDAEDFEKANRLAQLWQ